MRKYQQMVKSVAIPIVKNASAGAEKSFIEVLKPIIAKPLKLDHIPIQEQIVILFPGLGTQHIKMGQKVVDNAASLKLFEEANEFLGYNLLDICLHGPKSKLDQTIYSSLAVFVCSLAALEKLKSEQPDFLSRTTATAGMSVGEFAALVLADVMDFKDALKVLKVGVEASHECCQVISSGMMTVRVTAISQLDLAIAEAREEAREHREPGICEVSNYLACGIKVIGGTERCLDFMEVNANRLRYQVIKRLPVGGAFHTRLMTPAGKCVEQALEEIDVRSPKMAVYSNYSGKLFSPRPQDIIKNIARQVHHPVKWEQIAQLLFRKNQDDCFPSYF